MSSRVCVRHSKQTQLSSGTEQVAAARTCAKNPQRVSCNVMYLFPLSPEKLIQENLYDMGEHLRLVHSGGGGGGDCS